MVTTKSLQMKFYRGPEMLVYLSQDLKESWIDFLESIQAMGMSKERDSTLLK